MAKTALGTERYLDLHRAETALAAIAAARAEGYQVVGIELADGAVPLHELDLGDADLPRSSATRTAAAPPPTLAACDAVAFLPQLGRVGSLNVATAASIACYEVRRRAWTDGDRNSRGGGRHRVLAFRAMADHSVRLLTDDELTAATRLVGRQMLGSVTDEVAEGWADLFRGQGNVVARRVRRQGARRRRRVVPDARSPTPGEPVRAAASPRCRCCRTTAGRAT